MTDVAELDRAVAEAEQRVAERRGEARRLVTQGKAAEAAIGDLEAREAVLDEAIAALNSVADQRQEDLQRRIEMLVTHGLRAVFGSDLEFKLVSGTKGKYATTDFVIRSQVGGEWIETPVLKARGGGVAAVVGFVLRVVMVLLRQEVRPTLLLDETFAQLSAEYEEPLAQFIRELADRTGMQFILVTHSAAYDAVADTAYRLELRDGVTQIERVT